MNDTKIYETRKVIFDYVYQNYSSLYVELLSALLSAEIDKYHKDFAFLAGLGKDVMDKHIMSFYPEKQNAVLFNKPYRSLNIVVKPYMLDAMMSRASEKADSISFRIKSFFFGCFGWFMNNHLNNIYSDIDVHSFLQKNSRTFWQIFALYLIILTLEEN